MSMKIILGLTMIIMVINCETAMVQVDGDATNKCNEPGNTGED